MTESDLTSSPLSPQVAFVLVRMIANGGLSEDDLTHKTFMMVKLLVKRGLAVELAPGRWEATAAGRVADVSMSVPDNYEVVTSQFGLGTPFFARHNGAEGVFKAVEHSNGRSWCVVRVGDDSRVPLDDLKDIRSAPATA